MSEPLIEIAAVEKSFKKGDRQELLVLHDINLKIYEGEIVAILGKSGSGKSTLLRIIAGLIDASNGNVDYRGKPVSWSGARYFHGVSNFRIIAVAYGVAKCGTRS